MPTALAEQTHGWSGLVCTRVAQQAAACAGKASNENGGWLAQERPRRALYHPQCMQQLPGHQDTVVASRTGSPRYICRW